MGIKSNVNGRSIPVFFIAISMNILGSENTSSNRLAVMPVLALDRQPRMKLSRVPNLLMLFSLLVFIITLTGCSSDSTQSSSNSSTLLVCDSITTKVPSGRPLTRLAVNGLSGADEATDWVVASDNKGVSIPTALYGSESDGYEILVPLHPDGPSGGVITLAVTDGKSSCPGIQINVKPLAPITGNPVQKMTTALARIADGYAAQYGVDLSVLAATPLNQLDPELVPLAVLVETLSVFDVDTEFAKLGAAEIATMQGLLDTIGIADLLDTLANEISLLPVTAAVITPAAKTMKQGLETTGTGVTLNRLMTAQNGLTEALRFSGCTDLGAVTNQYLGISTPEQLSEYMKAARGAADSIGPLKRGITDLNSGFAALGLVPGGGWATAGVGIVWGWSSYAVDLAYQMRANLYPSAITRVEFGVDQTRIPEDWNTSQDGEINWRFAKLYATNNGMNLSRAIVDGTLNVVSSTFAAAGAPHRFLSEAEAASSGVVDIVGRGAIDARLDALNNSDSDTGCWNVAATEFGPITIDDNSGDEWVSAAVIVGEAITVVDRSITPTKIGTSTLRVLTNTLTLPGPQGFGDQIIEVARKAVRWIPATLFVQNVNNEETVSFRFDDTKHYEETQVLVEPNPGITGLSKTNLGGGLYQLTFTTPLDRGVYPLQIKVSSTSPQLLPGTPERSAILAITLDEEITITPREKCVPNGDLFNLTAVVSSINPNPEISWEIKSGSGILAGTGTSVFYSAPLAGKGSVVIRAFLASDSTVEDEVTLSYGNCVDVAVFYQFDGQYNLPGLDPGCSTSNFSFEEFDIHNDNDDNDGKNPEIPLDSFWGPDQQISIDEVLGSTGQRGTPDIGGGCVAGTFPADLTNISTIAVASSGDRVNYTMDMTAHAVCGTFANAIADYCSSASTTTNVYAVYELAIDAAVDYQLEANLICTFKDTPGFSNVTVAIIRYDMNQNPVSINSTLPVIFSPMSCNSNSLVNFSEIVHFDTPVIGDTTDRAVVQFITVLGASANPADDAITEGISSMDGYVRVYEVVQ